MDLQLLEGVLEVLPHRVRRHDEERDLVVRLAACNPGEDVSFSAREAGRARLCRYAVEPFVKRDEEGPQELEQVAISLDEVADAQLANARVWIGLTASMPGAEGSRTRAFRFRG